jgi:TolA-binding protein
MCLYWLGRDEEAVRSCQAFVERYPESQWTPAVMFWMGEIAFNQGRYEAAESQFAVFAEKYPLDGRAEEALLWAGRAAIQRAEYLHAIDVLGRLVKNYPGGRMVPDARFAQGEALSSLARFPEAILAFDEIINKYPASERFAEAWLRKGDCQFMLGAEDEKRYEEAVQSFRVAVSSPNVAPDELLQAEYKIGRCYEKQGKISAALEQYYTRVIVKFLDSRAKGLRPTESARTWFARAVYNAADILEARQEWRQVVSVLERLREVGMTVPAETEERIRRIRADHWLLF